MCYSASNYLNIFCCCFCCWVIVLLHCDLIKCRELFLFSYIFWGLLCTIRYDLFWRKFQGLLRRMYIVLLQDGILCRRLSGHLVLGFLCWLFVWMTSIGDRGLLKSPTTTVLVSICAFNSFSVCLMKLGALTLGAHRLIIVISFWCIVPFISMRCPSLSYLTNVSLKSTLSNISIATPAYLGEWALAW
jgi:hypothetical protein